MDKLEKEALLKQLMNTEDDALLNQVKEILNFNESDFWKNLNPVLKTSLERGIEQADKGDLTPHSEVMKKFRDQYKG